MVRVCDVADYRLWPEEDQVAIYRMVDAVNDVIGAIMADGQFTRGVTVSKQ